MLSEKRQAYLDLVNSAFKSGTEGLDQAVRRDSAKRLDAPGAYLSRRFSPPGRQMWHQITIDIPRTRPNVPLWTMKPAQRVRLPRPVGVCGRKPAKPRAGLQALERILYVWAIRHPDSGYVQGINDLVIPFFQTFLAAYISRSRSPSLLALLQR